MGILKKIVLKLIVCDKTPVVCGDLKLPSASWLTSRPANTNIKK